MGNGSKKLGWMPADDEQKLKAEAGEIYQGQDGNWYQHPNIQEASRKNPPAPALNPPEVTIADASNAPPPIAAHSTPPAVNESGPSSADLDAVVAEEAVKHAAAAPPPLPTPVSFAKAVPGGPTNPSYDADTLDSTGKNVKDGVQVGPRGVDQPADLMTEAERAKAAADREAKLAKGMSPTHSVDSTGKPKGKYLVIPQGYDKHGMRLPDKIDYSKPIETLNPVHGPRGLGAPKDTFHRG